MASPDCATFSVAAISHHRRKNEETGNLDPISDYAKFCDEVDQHVLQLIGELKPQFFFIENPRGGMRKMSWMQGIPRYTVTYCQYGDTRMKPTDIWTNHPNPQFKPPCKNGDTCHEPAPRGSSTRTQGLNGSKEKAVIPEALCQHIVDICETYYKEREEKEMELKVQTPTFPDIIQFNYEELKQEITAKASRYVNIVYSDDQIQDAKKDRATLNKFVKALSDERIKVKKECLKPYEDFERKIKELDGIVSEAIKNIDSQVKSYEEEKKKEKENKIHLLIDAVLEGTKSLGWLTHEKIWNDKWLNASVSIKAIQEEINGILAKIETDLSTLQNMPEIAFEATDIYKRSLDLNMAISEGQRLAEMQKRKAEQEKAKAERLKAEMAAEESGEAVFNNAPDFSSQRQWLGFKAHLTVEDAQQLALFFNSRGIEFEQITI